MNKNVIIAAVIGVIVVIFAFYFLFGDKVKSTMTPKSDVSPTRMSTTGNRHAPVSEITVEANDFSFYPSTIVAVHGKKLSITLKNIGKNPHNLTIKGMGASKTVQPGQSDTFTLTPEKSGMFQFSCTVDSHASKGMVGVLMIQ